MNNLKFKLMTKKNLFLVALAAVAFAACSDDFADAPPVVTPTPENYEIPIVFNSASNGSMTRANYFEGAVAADMLGGKFVVSGYKGAKSLYSTTATPASSIVFDNFLVEWGENTANTTESNSSNWEYAGKGLIKHAEDNGITRQSIKYWDFTYPQYDFIAWSTGKKTAIYEEPAGGIPLGKVLVSEITPQTATGATGSAFTMKGAAADLSQCYIADLVTVKKADYKKTVKLTFRSLGTKVRVGIYETIPGYSVKNVKFYSAAASNDASATAARLFTTDANSIFTEGTYTIYYPTVDDATPVTDLNQAHIKFDGGTSAQSTTVGLGSLNYTIAEDAEKEDGAVYLGRSSNTATFAGDADNNYYEFFIPNENAINLNLRVDYTLESIDGTGEIINVRGATAQVPAIYAQWKPGFAYTYLFKISDKTNGFTGAYDPTQPDDIMVNSDPAGLYPITFDAVVVNSEEAGNTQETITTVSTPSITTYQKGSTVVNDNEYQAATGDIFVTVNDGTKETTPDLANGALQTLTGKAALYTLSATDPAGLANFTEAGVVDAMQMQEDNPADGVTIQGRNKLELTAVTTTLTNTIEYGVNGNAITVGAAQAMRFTPVAGKTYAFVYTKKAVANTTNKYQPVTVAKGASVKGLYRWPLKNAPAGDVQKGVLYFKNKTSDAEKVFLGQIVNNLYLDNQGTVASGYAVTGTLYYYTIDNGQNYLQAYVVPFEDFATLASTGKLYVWDTATSTYVATTDTDPQDGTAYYYSAGGAAYTYCVIYPQQTNPAGGDRLKIQGTTSARVACDDTDVAYNGWTYFDKYTQNDGVYYAKIIKVE